jgi:hypothetical protein
MVGAAKKIVATYIVTVHEGFTDGKCTFTAHRVLEPVVKGDRQFV